MCGGTVFFVFFKEKADSFEYRHECEKDNLFSVPRTNITGSLLDRSRLDTAHSVGRVPTRLLSRT